MCKISKEFFFNFLTAWEDIKLLRRDMSKGGDIPEKKISDRLFVNFDDRRTQKWNITFGSSLRELEGSEV